MGISDPFPEDTPHIRKLMKGNPIAGLADSLLFECVEHLVYSSHRYVMAYSPYMLYIPRKEVMFKIMRACINVTDPLDLWLNKTPDFSM